MKTQSRIILILLLPLNLFLSCTAYRITFDQSLIHSTVDKDHLARFEKPCSDESIFVDPRDSTVYNIIKIGNQCWMKENLKWLPKVYNNRNGSHVEPRYYVYDYSGSDSYDVDKVKGLFYKSYGVLYNWPAAVTACPPGWRLPAEEDFDSLYFYLTSNYEHINDFNLSRILRSCLQSNSPVNDSCRTQKTPFWYISNNLDFAIDEFGMSLLAEGYRSISGNYNNLRHSGHWWTADEVSAINATAHSLIKINGKHDLSINLGDKSSGASVRCIRGDEHETRIPGRRYEILDEDAFKDWSERYNYLVNRKENKNRLTLLAIFPSFLITGGLILMGPGYIIEGLVSASVGLGLTFLVRTHINRIRREFYDHQLSIHEQEWLRKIDN